MLAKSQYEICRKTLLLYIVTKCTLYIITKFITWKCHNMTVNITIGQFHNNIRLQSQSGTALSRPFPVIPHSICVQFFICYSGVTLSHAPSHSFLPRSSLPVGAPGNGFVIESIYMEPK